GSAMLYAATMANEWRVGLLADEAHNLVERARTMYSASLSQATLRALRSTAPAPVRQALQKMSRAWTALRKAQEDGEAELASLPAGFVTALRQAAQAMEAHLAQAAPGTADSALQQAYFDILA